MSMPPNPPGGSRMSRSVRLVLMGVAGAALLYSCAPGVSAGLGALPYLWFLPNPFYRSPVAAPCLPGSVDCQQQANQSSSSSGTSSRGGSSSTRSSTSGSTTDTAKAGSTESSRGGFGSTGSHIGSSGTS